MTVKLAYNGELPEERHYEITCTYCESRLNFMRADVTPGTMNMMSSIRCPKCKTLAYLEADVENYRVKRNDY